MVKKFAKSILTLGLLLSVPQFSLRSEGTSVQVVDFGSYLQPQDLVLMEQDEAMDHRSKHKDCGKFCTLFVQNRASIGCLNVRNNIIFNTAGTNTLNVQGAVEAKSRLIRGTILLTPTGTVTLSSLGGTDSHVTVEGSLPTADAISGSGFTVATPTGLGFSSGIIATTTRGTATGSEFYFIIGFQIPITFPNPYSSLPTIVATLQSPRTLIGSALLAGFNSITAVDLQVTNLTLGGAMLNLQFHIASQGFSDSVAENYTNALFIAQEILNDLLSSSLSINFLSDGPVN